MLTEIILLNFRMKLCLPSDQEHQIQRQDIEYKHYLEKKQEEEDILARLNEIRGKSINQNRYNSSYSLSKDPYRDSSNDNYLIQKLKQNEKIINKQVDNYKHEKQEIQN